MAAADDSREHAPEIRKTVTVLFADVTSSTALGEQLDAESLRRLMGRYFDEMQAVLERHGGTVEKFIGDAVMAVFGIPVIREDDSLRAVRAALEMREALERLNDGFAERWGVRLAARIGVNTGEIVSGDPTAGERLAVGDAVNVAARLEQAAGAGEVLIGRGTYLLVRDVVETVELEPLTLKGKAEPVLAYRVEHAVPEAALPVRHLDAPLVGRTDELEQLASAFESAVAQRSCRLFALVGPPGVGKSRLTAEALRAIGERATVLVGRCLPYGEGITYWPIADAVKQAVAIGDADTEDDVHAKVAALVEDAEEAPIVARNVAQLLGVGEATATSDEMFWAVRKLLEGAASTRPLVLVLEDLHWAEPTLLDLVEYVAEWWRDAPLLLVCLARPELLDERPSWLRLARATCVFLAPLGEEETDALIDTRLRGLELAEPVREQIKEAAEGNPLFVEQMLAMIDAGDAAAASLVVPPTIQAVLAARLELLEPDERRLLERASVMGRMFWWEAVRALSPERLWPQLSGHLMSLIRKELIAPDHGTSGREHGFRFRHALIRDAAYGAIPKQARSTLHEQYAGWLEERGGESDEIVGYHLEQAYRYCRELGRIDERGSELGARAAARLAAAGRRALARGDMPAAANLLERTVELLPHDGPERRELLPELGRALTEIGSLTRAAEVLDEAVASAEAAGDACLRSTALVDRALLRLYTHPDSSRGTHELVEAANEAVAVFERCGDEAGLARAWGKLAMVHWTRCCYGEMEQALEQALAHAERAGDRHEQAAALSLLARAALLGPLPVETAIERCRMIRVHAGGDRQLHAVASLMIAGLEAMRGRFDEARALYAECRASFEEFGLRRWIAALAQWSGPAELLAGDPGRAEAELRASYESLREMGDRGLLAPVAAFLAQALYAQERYDEADELARESEAAASSDDLFPHVVWRGVRAKVLARRGEHAVAAALAREAVSLAEETDSLNLQGDAWLDLAEVLCLGECEDEAAAATARAAERYEAKGNVVAAAIARRRLTIDTSPSSVAQT